MELVSIVVPVYNAEKFIAQTMDCVRAQTYSEWELLLVEDQSKDGTVSVIEKYLEETGDTRIRLIRQPQNAGAAKARNAGISMASGRFLAFLDADDFWLPEKLQKQVAFMEEKQVAFGFMSYEFADENGVGLGTVVHVPATITYREALKNTTIFTTTVMFDTTRISKELISFPAIKSEDTALWWKILRTGVVGYGLDENLVKYRRSAQTLSSNKVEAMRRIWNLYRKSEGMGIVSSAWHFCFWALNAVRRRI